MAAATAAVAETCISLPDFPKQSMFAIDFFSQSYIPSLICIYPTFIYPKN